jgi:hypothetical protein
LPVHERDTFTLLKTGKISSLNGTKNPVLFPAQRRFFSFPGKFSQKKIQEFSKNFIQCITCKIEFWEPKATAEEAERGATPFETPTPR